MCTLFLAPWQQHDETWSGENGQKIANKFRESDLFCRVQISEYFWIAVV